MDYNNQGWQPGSNGYQQNASPYRSPVPRRRPTGFATASLVLGIIAFLSVFSMTVLPPLVFGSLSIILGILSRGNQKRPGNRALGGIVISASALVINLAICIFSFYIVFSDPNATNQYWNLVNDTYEQMLGVSLEDILETYGFNITAQP